MRKPRRGIGGGMAKRLLLAGLVLLLVGLVQPCHAGTFFDDFTDGDTAGWIRAEPYPYPAIGNWHVEDGVLVQNYGGDWHMFLVEDHVVSTHSITTRLRCNDPAGYGGVVLWHQGSDNYVFVIVYPSAHAIWIHEIVDREPLPNSFVYPFPAVKDAWYELRVEADSASGTLTVYVDGNYLFTYSVTTTHRTGLAGLFSGNSGGAFDDVQITSEDIPVHVAIDIKPQSCPNPINVKSQGVLPVAILGTAEFDVTTINPASIRLAGVAAIRSALEDVATPFTPSTGEVDAYSCTDLGPDGFRDLTLKFDTQLVAATLGTVNDGDVLSLPLTGNLLNGTPIQGQDVVVILKKGKK